MHSILDTDENTVSMIVKDDYCNSDNLLTIQAEIDSSWF
jgi:hypothetical protein